MELHGTLHHHVYHHHEQDDRIIVFLLNQIINKLDKMAADLTTLETEVSENGTAIGSAVVLLQGLKAALDAAGTDPVKLKALSDQLSAQTDSLAAAVVENTPAAEPE